MSLLIGATSALQGAAGSGGGASFTLDQSLRFSGSSTVLSNTSIDTGATSQVLTFSCWMKLADSTQNGVQPFRDGTESNAVGNFQINTSGTSIGNGAFTFNLANGSDGFVPTMRFRDPSAWYHIVLRYNGPSTACQLWVNGEAITAGTGTLTTGSGGIRLHGFSFGNNNWQGYLAEAILVESQLSATDFGEYNDDHVWVPKAYSGTYGSEGFRLTFDSTQSPNGVGTDSSGNGNHFTASGFNTTAISSSNKDNDIDFNDTPTSNYATLNPLFNNADHTPRYFGVTKEANLAAKTDGSEADWATTSNIELTDGKWYFEVTYTNNLNVGVGGGQTTNNRAAITAQTGNAFTENTFGSSGSNPNSGSQTSGTIGCRVDTTNRTVAWTWDGSTYTGNLSYNDPGHKVFPYVNVGAAQPSNTTLKINHGQMPFQYSVPTGFEGALQTNKLPEPTIKNGRDYFDVIIWSGDNTSPRTITGLEFQPDLIWTKRRNSTASHLLYDSVRGFGDDKHLHTDKNKQEGSLLELNTDVAGYVSNNASNGFVLTAGTSNHDATNGSGNTYVAWCWKAGGAAVSNTDGTITSSVSANTTAGFSIVTYTGNGSNSTVGHGLNQAPELVMYKRRNADQGWGVYSSELAANQYLQLDVTSAAFSSQNTIFNNTRPTSSVLHIGTQGSTNTSGGTYVAYCWHAVKGYSEFGSYKGNGNAQGPFIYLGFRPAFIMVRRAIGGDANWQIMDTTRSTSNPADKWIEANEAAAEQTGNSFIKEDFLSNGFAPRGGASSQDNISGNTYIYMAFAENPFGGENAPPVTAR